MKILVFGPGQLANFLKEAEPKIIVSQVDIGKAQEVERDITKNKPDAVINTAAKTGVDWCQENPLEAFRINTLAAYELYQICNPKKIFFCQISTGCIYHNPLALRPITENQRPNPQSFYAFSKLWIEELLAGKPNLLILRPRLFLSAKPGPKNLISRWLKMNRFVTNLNSRTILEDAAPIIIKMVQRKITGTYHLVNPHTNSDFDCAEILKEKINPAMAAGKIDIEELNQEIKVPRVAVVLSTLKLKRLGLELPNFEESFRRTVEKYRQNLLEESSLTLSTTLG